MWRQPSGRQTALGGHSHGTKHDAKCAPGRRGRETFRWLIILSFLPGMLVLMIVFGLFARDVPAGFPIWICGAWLTAYAVTELYSRRHYSNTVVMGPPVSLMYSPSISSGAPSGSEEHNGSARGLTAVRFALSPKANTDINGTGIGRRN
jgi:hypothetical protein